MINWLNAYIYIINSYNISHTFPFIIASLSPWVFFAKMTSQAANQQPIIMFGGLPKIGHVTQWNIRTAWTMNQVKYPLNWFWVILNESVTQCELGIKIWLMGVNSSRLLGAMRFQTTTGLGAAKPGQNLELTIRFYCFYSIFYWWCGWSINEMVMWFNA